MIGLLRNKKYIEIEKIIGKSYLDIFSRVTLIDLLLSLSMFSFLTASS